MAVTHELKTAAPYFAAVVLGMKTFDIRFNDRKFEVGDLLYLREYVDDDYTGRAAVRRVSYVMDDPQYVVPGSVVLGLAAIDSQAVIEQILAPGCHDVTPTPGRPGNAHCAEHGFGPSTVGGECRFTTAAHIAWYILENPDA